MVSTKRGEVVLDGARRVEGRGAYVCDAQECLDKVNTKNLLSKAFKKYVKFELTGRANE